MKNKPYLIFFFNGLSYAIDAQKVKEIFLLPELTILEEAPKDIVGILNLRSKIVPILHLDLRFDHPFQECHINDNVIVVESHGFLAGIIVHEADEIKLINSSVIETDVTYGRVKDINSVFVSGVAKVDNDLIILLDVDNLIRHPQSVKALITETEEIEKKLAPKNNSIDSKKVISNFYDLCCPKATLKEREIFRRRADNLRASNETLDIKEQIPIAVIELNNKYFGIELKCVREFTNINNITAIPCCPDHIVGYTNLRGEIVTLVDIRNKLNLPDARVSNNLQAVIIDVNQLVAGLSVDEVFDVIYLRPTDISNSPLAVNFESEQYSKGTIFYQNKMLSFLDLNKILAY